MATPPFIVNIAPTPDEFGSGLTSPIRLSMRDADTYVVPTSVQVVVGYSSVKADGMQKFEEVLPRTTRYSTLPGPVDLHTQPNISVVSNGISITKTEDTNQQSVYVTSIDASSGIHSCLGTAVVIPSVITNDQPGAVLAVENGPRNTGVYILFEKSSGMPFIRMCGPENSVGIRSPDTILASDWSGENRYVVVWNEARLRVELYRIDSSGTTTLINFENISSFQAYDSVPGGTPRIGGSGDITLLYGIEGKTGEQAIIGEVAVTIDVGFPIIGLTRTGEFSTIRRTDETVRYEGGDPIKAVVSSWFGPDDRFFASPDPLGAIKVLPNNSVRLAKLTSGDSMALYREEPALLGSDTNGFMIEGSFFAIVSQLISSKVTGMGFFIFDGQSVYYLSLLSGNTRTVGILRRGRDPSLPSSFQTPITDLSWASAAYFRLVVDPRRGLIDLYGDDISSPLLTIPFDRSQLSDPSEFGLTGLSPFIAFGHISPIDTLGSFDLSRLTYACTYQAYEAKDGVLPDNVASSPVWTTVAGGITPGSLPNPLFNTLLGGGFGLLPPSLYIGAISPPVDIVNIVDGQLVLETNRGSTRIYTRSVAIDPDRGITVEIGLQITKYKARSRTGYYVLIDDGVNTYALSFVDTEIGKFICVPIRSGTDLVEKVGTEGQAAQLSAQINWDASHIYRIERRPLDGIYLFIDNAIAPAIVLLDTDRVDYPQSQFFTPTLVFGHFKGEGATSLTDFVRVAISEGYEISTKKVDDTSQLEQDIRNTQAIVVALARDNDP